MIELNDEFWKFVENNLNSDPSALRLKYHGKAGIGFDVGFAITQIECRRKFSKKLAATLSEFPRFIFPSVLAGEQATSDRFAQFHASILKQIKPSSDKRLRVADLTAGLGIDVFHIARFAYEVVAIELDSERADCLRHNAKGLSSGNVKVIEGDCCKFLEDDSIGRFDALFIDPARRAADGSRVYALSDCQPDVVSLMPKMLRISDCIIIKMSPMLDISQVLRELPSTSRIIALGSTTDCRELVAVVDPEERTGKIEAVTLTENGSKTFTIDLAVESKIDLAVESKIYLAAESEEDPELPGASFGNPTVGDMLVEPYPAVMKVGYWQTFANRYGLKMLSSNSHLFLKKKSEISFESTVSEKVPAVMLEVLEVFPYQSKIIKRFKKEYPKISITCRNFDIAPEMLRKKLGVADGGSLRLFATKDSSGSPLLIVARPL